MNWNVFINKLDRSGREYHFTRQTIQRESVIGYLDCLHLVRKLDGRSPHIIGRFLQDEDTEIVYLLCPAQAPSGFREFVGRTKGIG